MPPTRYWIPRGRTIPTSRASPGCRSCACWNTAATRTSFGFDEGRFAMPVHDWTRVSDGTFHDFHYSWVLEIKRALKRGLLPKGYYVMAEQFGGDIGAPDVLTLQAADKEPPSEGPLSGTATLTESPPAVQVRTTIQRDPYTRVQRTLVIRHTSDDRIVAMIEVL